MAFQWTKPRATAAVLLAEDKLTDEQIAAKVGVAPRTLWEWKERPEFQGRIAEHAAKQATAIESAVIARGIAERQNRIDALNDRWGRMTRVIAERAAEQAMQGVPGGKTGLLVRSYKGIGKGDSLQLFEEYEVDTGLLKELRAHEQQAAQELGQWIDKQQQDVALSGQVQFIPIAPPERAK